MELEGDNPAPRHFPTPEPVATQNIQVSPENVVALAALFRECADRLEPELLRIQNVMRVPPLMGDPVSSWLVDQLNEYLHNKEHAFVKVIQSDFEQHTAIRDALVATAQRYGLTEELIEAGFADLTPPK
jgi:hypothetical protein